MPTTAHTRFAVPGPFVLAPMAGVTDAAFRGICRTMGAALSYTEMVSAAGLHHGSSASHSRELLRPSAAEDPLAVQLFGSDPELIARAGRLVEADLGTRLHSIDVNMGCPVAKVVGKGEGSALMREPARAARIVSELVRSVSVPVTVKIRSGWDEGSVNAVEFAGAMVDAGASAVTVHGRTRGQLYRGRSDWSVVAAVKRAVDVPVMGSGDVFSAEDAVRMLEETGVDAVMVARGSQGNPWLFPRAAALLAGEPDPGEPDAKERLRVARLHARELAELTDPVVAALRMRKHLMWYTHGLSGATHFRERVNATPAFDDLMGLVDEYERFLDR